MKTAGLLGMMAMAAMGLGVGDQAGHAATRKAVRPDLDVLAMGGLPRLKHVRAETYPGQHTAHLVGAWRGDGTPGPMTRQQRRAKGERWGMQGQPADTKKMFCRSTW